MEFRLTSRDTMDLDIKINITVLGQANAFMYRMKQDNS